MRGFIRALHSRDLSRTIKQVHMKSWPHAPSKQVDVPGTYMVTSSTYHKRLLFDSSGDLEMLQESLFAAAEEFGFQLQAWAIFPNHYHVIGFAANGVKELTKILHGRTSRELNRLHGCQGRTVWYRSWDTLLTFEKSYLARLHYVHQNPVRHRVAARAEDYRWCSAKWFEDGCERAFYDTVNSFPIDHLNVFDDFEVDWADESAGEKRG
ncbi:MAG: transposase [Fimbriimonadales bacterium]